ncbi:MAG: hypothetical protein Q9165_003422 [Trypethelium subeluteriae]
MQSCIKSPETILKASKPLPNLLTEEPDSTASLAETCAIDNSETGDINSVEGSQSTSADEMSQPHNATQTELIQESALQKIMTSSRREEEAAGASGPMALVPHFRFLFVQEKLSEFASNALTTLASEEPKRWSSRVSNASEASRSSKQPSVSENLSTSGAKASNSEDEIIETAFKAPSYESNDDYSIDLNGSTNSINGATRDAGFTKVSSQDASRDRRGPRGRMSSEPSSSKESHNRNEKDSVFEKPVRIMATGGDFSVPWEVAKRWKPAIWDLMVQPGRSFNLSIWQGRGVDPGEPRYTPDNANNTFDTARGGPIYAPWPGQSPTSPFPMPPPDYAYPPYPPSELPERPKEKETDTEYKELKALLENQERLRIERENELRAREIAAAEAKKRAEEAARALEQAASNARREAEMKAGEEARRAKEEADRALQAATREAEDAKRELERQRNKKWWNRLGANSGDSNTRRASSGAH